MSSSKFTARLLAKHTKEWTKATQHPFLVEVGQGIISADALTKWCRQDYLYASVGYVKFTSSLLSRIPMFPNPPTDSTSPLFRTYAEAIPVLISSLSQIKIEVELFLSTAAEHGLDLFPSHGVMPDTGLLGGYEGTTKAYVDALIATGSNASVEEGLVMLWAMEKCYLDSWLFAKSHQSSSKSHVAVAKACRTFTDNWTSPDFQQFVQQCADLVNGLELDSRPDIAQKCEDVFKYVVWLEQRFWPEGTDVVRGPVDVSEL